MTDERRDALIETISNALIYHDPHCTRRDRNDRESIAKAWADDHPELVNELVERHGEYISDIVDDQDVMAAIVDYARDHLGVDYLNRYRTPLYP